MRYLRSEHNKELLSFFSRLCFKLLKRLLYDCQCLLTCVFLLCTGKVHRWKFFYCLCGFLWQFTWAYLSVKWVINPLPHIWLLFFFLLQLLHQHLLYVKSFLIEYYWSMTSIEWLFNSYSLSRMQSLHQQHDFCVGWLSSVTWHGKFWH